MKSYKNIKKVVAQKPISKKLLAADRENALDTISKYYRSNK